MFLNCIIYSVAQSVSERRRVSERRQSVSENRHAAHAQCLSRCGRRPTAIVSRAGASRASRGPRARLVLVRRFGGIRLSARPWRARRPVSLPPVPTPRPLSADRLVEIRSRLADLVDATAAAEDPAAPRWAQRLGEIGTHPRAGPRSLRGVSRPRICSRPCPMSTFNHQPRARPRSLRGVSRPRSGAYARAHVYFQPPGAGRHLMERGASRRLDHV